MSALRVRRERLADDALVVVRGDDLGEATLRGDALRTHRRVGEYGVSVLAAPSEGALDDLSRGPLVRFEVLTVMNAGAIRRAGLELRPTFRWPHYTVMLPDLDRDVSRLIQCENERRTNPHFVPQEPPP